MDGDPHKRGVTAAVVALLTVALLGTLAVVPSGSTEIVEGSSHFVPRPPIVIDGDTEFTPANGVVGGSGTPEDPYLIAGWRIEGAIDVAVIVSHTTSHFVIQDIRVEPTSAARIGVNLRFAPNATIRSSAWAGTSYPIHVVQSVGVEIVDNEITSGGTGIFVEASSLVDLRGNAIANSGLGIRVELSSTVVIEGNNLAASRGIEIFGCSLVDVRNNAGGQRIHVWAGSETTIEGHTLEELFLEGGEDAELRNNAVGFLQLASVNGTVLESNALGRLFFVGAVGVTMRDNALTGGGLTIFNEFLDSFASHDIDTSNLVNARPLRYYTRCQGVSVESVPTGQLIVADCDGFTARGLTVEGSEQGFVLRFSRNVLIEQNVIERAVMGISAAFSSDLTLRGNVVRESSQSGVNVHSATDVWIENNTMTENENGLRLANAARGVVRGNLIARNNLGLSLEGTSQVQVYSNEFVDNGHHARESGGIENAWDADYPLGGNFWTGYGGVDDCSGPAQDVCPDPDGIGDTPFTLEEVHDRYPLVRSGTSLPAPALILIGVAAATAAFLGFLALLFWRKKTKPGADSEDVASRLGSKGRS